MGPLNAVRSGIQAQPKSCMKSCASVGIPVLSLSCNHNSLSMLRTHFAKGNSEVKVFVPRNSKFMDMSRYWLVKCSERRPPWVLCLNFTFLFPL